MKHKGIRIALAVIEACSGLCDKKRDKQPLAYADLPLIESRRQPLLGPRRVPRPRSSSGSRGVAIWLACALRVPRGGNKDGYTHRLCKKAWAASIARDLG